LPTIEQILRPVCRDIQHFEERLNSALRSDVDFVARYDGIRYAQDRAKAFSEHAYRQIEPLDPSDARDALMQVALYAAERDGNRG